MVSTFSISWKKKRDPFIQRNARQPKATHGNSNNNHASASRLLIPNLFIPTAPYLIFSSKWNDEKTWKTKGLWFMKKISLSGLKNTMKIRLMSFLFKNRVININCYFEPSIYLDRKTNFIHILSTKLKLPHLFSRVFFCFS